MSNSVNTGDTEEPLLHSVLEAAMARLREVLYEVSRDGFPGLRARHYRLLSFIPDGGVRVSDISDVSGLTKQALAQTLALVRDQGCVDVVDDPADRRARLVVLTDRGREALAAVRVRTAALELQWAQQVGARRYAVARSVLSEIAGGVDSPEPAPRDPGAP